MAKNLITGGLGFIGFHLSNLLLEHGEEVTIFDVAAGSRLFRDIQDRITLIRGDVSNWSQVLDAVRTSGTDCIASRNLETVATPLLSGSDRSRSTRSIDI